MDLGCGDGRDAIYLSKKGLKVTADVDDPTAKNIFDHLSNILKRGGLIFVTCKSTDDPLFGQGEKVGENMYKKEHLRQSLYKRIYGGEFKEI